MKKEEAKAPYELEQERAAFRSWLSVLDKTEDESRNLALRNMRIAVKEELTDRQREILLLYYCSTPRMTMEDIGKELGIDKSSVSRTVSRGRKRLLRVLKYSSPALLADTVKKGAYKRARKNKRNPR